jgi:hypothetical protein
MMNKTNLELIYLNQSSSIMELFFVRMGSFHLIKDQIYLFFILPSAVICILLNCLTLVLLQSKIVQKTSLNTLIKIFTFTSLLMCILTFMRGFGNIPRYTSLSYSYPARVISCQVTPYLAYAFVSFSNALNIAILVERLSTFVIKYSRFNCKNPNYLIRHLIIISVLINLFIFFQTETKNENEFNRQKSNITTLINLLRCDKTNFSQTIFGKVSYLFTIIIVNFVTLLIELIVSYQSIKYFKRYLKHKRDLINLNDHRMWEFNNNTNEIYQLAVINHNNNSQPMTEEFKERELKYEIDVNLTRYMIGLNILSVLSNLISLLISIYYILVGLDVVFSYMAIFVDILNLIKHGSPFLFLILLNKHFRNYFFSVKIFFQ